MIGRKNLNFNAPLLFVRRFSSPSASEDRRSRKRTKNPLPNRRLALPLCGSDLELDQVTKPVAIPFNWEKIPGRPKDGFMDIIKQGGLCNPKASSWKECDDTDKFRCQIVPYSSTDKGLSRGGINDEGDSNLRDEDGVYSDDALDTLSPTDSFSMNYSASGPSGSDGLDEKRSGTFSTDPQTQDFGSGKEHHVYVESLLTNNKGNGSKAISISFRLQGSRVLQLSSQEKLKKD
ncbi:hypothetical protein CJ030_MR3G011144 [Morella rubra]|uniref:Uncharacterized protein n=1 Tax=Morella rubra TaxID=262757 RepID=A0A6A1W5J5_9ROSI|nr:hypothetical protein CJ030_MR3G011144 [Morella rubra]